ncbi:MAG: T9SS type A sorting domain-containing protein [candidate division WOR-3 bacterium]
MKIYRYLIFLVLTLPLSKIYGESKIVWFNYSATGCITCHRIASVKMSDTLYLIGSFHAQGSILNPFIIAVDSQLNIKWYKAYAQSQGFYGVDAMVKINDSLVAISGGHGNSGDGSFFGVFNIKAQNFVWVKYRQVSVARSASAIDFDGNYIMLGVQEYQGFSTSWYAKLNTSGNIIWSKSIKVCNFETAIIDGVYDGTAYVYVARCRPDYNSFYHYIVLLKVNVSDGSLIWAKLYDFGGNSMDHSEHPYRILKDNDGYIVIGIRCTDSHNCSTLGNDNILIFKADFQGNVVWSKLYYSPLLGGDQRAYNGTFDTDGNILVSGFIRTSSTSSYPIVLKINRTSGNLIWARYWTTPPQNQDANAAKGIISIGSGKFYLITFIGSGTNASGGLALLRENINLPNNCTQPINFTTNNITPIVSNPNPIISDANVTLNNLPLTPYIPNSGLTNLCSITPVNNYENYEDCNISIKLNKGMLKIASKSIKIKAVKIYHLSGRLVSQFNPNSNQVNIPLKNTGIYILVIQDDNFELRRTLIYNIKE